ncbi:uncharacterized protein LOC135198148 [Macrobrachium nipponense]|uniref:uncharacterized protein LOC135198148 n=1 Tax=Macrobrachium nipponense TaxID=159736 RepID=UPI0030C7F1AA
MTRTGDFSSGKKNDIYFICYKNHMLLFGGILWLSLFLIASAQRSEQEMATSEGSATSSYQAVQGDDVQNYGTTISTYHQEMATSPEGSATNSYQAVQGDDVQNYGTTISTYHQQNEYATNTVSKGSTTDSYQDDEGPRGCICSRRGPQEQRHMEMDSFIKSLEMWIMFGLAMQCIVLVCVSLALGAALHEARK